VPSCNSEPANPILQEVDSELPDPFGSINISLDQWAVRQGC
jgi:hypothetical protein